MNTSTKELIDRLTTISRVETDLYYLTAQRLRELDKPDCAWTSLPFGHGVIVYSPECCTMDSATDLPVRLSKYCHNCGGAVKEAV